jgi:Flp pilus assembly protein TadD
MPNNMLLRSAVALICVLLCLVGIWCAGATGLSRLYSEYALATSSLPPTEGAVLLTPSDPEAHYARALVLQDKRDLAEAVKEFERAVALRPRDYVYWYDLALARDNTGDGEGAIAACEQSVSLAPYYGRPHWLLGNLYFRAGRREEAFAELRRAASSDLEFLPSLIDLAWGTSNGDAGTFLGLVQPKTNGVHIALAQYLAKKGKYGEAIAMFQAAGEVSKDERRKFLQALLAAHQLKEAYAIWALEHKENNGEYLNGINTLTDPSFEGAIRPSEPGFGWQQPSPLENVRISVDANNPRTGQRSLLIEFNGNSDPGNTVISQIVLVEPETRYELHFAARTEKIVTGGLPQITVLEANGAGDSKSLASVTLPAESDSWHEYSISFTTGKAAQAMIIKVNRQSCSSSPCPAFGLVWLDDFKLLKQAKQ